MTFAIRAINLLFIVWLTAAASLPPCCWSMTGTHDHQAQHEAPAMDQHTHHHHEAPDSAVSTAATVLTATTAHDCDAESVQAFLTTRAFVPLDATRTADLEFANVVAAHVSTIWCACADPAPPGGSPGSAFLSPLRV